MGYTHYFDIKKQPTQKQFNKIVEDVRVIEKFFNENNILSKNAGGHFNEDFVKLFGGDGNHKGVHYVVDEQNGEKNYTAFYLNGDGTFDKGLSHEGFALFLDINCDEAMWSFCKTARKPYDLAVTLILLCAKYHLKGGIKITTDGGNDEWAHSFELFEDLFEGRKFMFEFEDYQSGSKIKDGSLKMVNKRKIMKGLFG
jgi:hypothetical protein